MFSLIIGITAMTATTTVTADDAVYTDKFVVSQSIHNNFRQHIYHNPAANFFRNDYSLTSIDFIGVKDNSARHKIAQTGKGNSYWGLRAKSQYIIDNNNHVWGEASYKKGKRDNVLWNETSDFTLLYPYVMADEKGGDLKYEQYYFDGGYAGRFKNLILGAAFRYRALNEYRTYDPRPNNIVADLNAKLGAGIVKGNHSLNIGFYAGKYKQTCDLRYFNELGASKEYHLTGLCNEFVRFSGACNNVFYKGHNLGTSIEFIPVNSKGLSFSLGYNRFSFDKILSTLNKLALNELSENKLTSEISWTDNINDKIHFGIKADASYSERKGHDNLFGDAVSNAYPKIGSILMYRSKMMYGRISGFYENTFFKHFPIGISPYVVYGSFESNHTESLNQFKSNSYILGALLKGCYRKGRNMLKLSVNTAYRIGIDTKVRISEDSCCNKSLFENLANTADYLSKNELNTLLSLRYQLQLKNKDISCYIETSWQHRSYLENNNDNIVSLTTGINL